MKKTKGKKQLRKLDRCKTPKDLFEYAKERGSNHIQYKKYSSYIVDMYDKKCLILSDGCCWDDSNDVENLRSYKKKLFASSFNCQISENYTMWKAYCDVEKQMLSINRNEMNIITNKKNIESCELINCNGKEIKLENHEFKIYVIDIIYKGKNNIYLHRDEKTKLEHKVVTGNKFIIKNYEYSDERECRLIVELKGDKDKFKDYNKCIIHFKDNPIDKTNIFVWDTDKYKYFQKSTVASNTRGICENKKCYEKINQTKDKICI